jgi:rhodanese-related sulfurtransferase
MTTAPTSLPTLSGGTTMAELLRQYPGAQRALFARYHIGGCRSCGFQPGETLAQVCARNEDIPVEEAIAHIQQSHEADASLQIAPAELSALRDGDSKVKILDVRSREEHEAVAIPGSRLLTQDLVQEIFNSWNKADPLVIYDHHGDRSLDAAAYFLGHGFSETKCLAGGIDAWSVEIDPSLPRYKVELED